VVSPAHIHPYILNQTAPYNQLTNPVNKPHTITIAWPGCRQINWSKIRLWTLLDRRRRVVIRVRWTIWSSREPDPDVAATTRTSARRHSNREAGMIWSHRFMCRPPSRQPPPSRGITWVPAGTIVAVSSPMAPSGPATMRTASMDPGTTERPRSSSPRRARPGVQVSGSRVVCWSHSVIGIWINHGKTLKTKHHTKTYTSSQTLASPTRNSS